MDQEYQRAVTRICVETALLLLQHGAESAVVVQMAQRLGVALGIESVECALTANAVLLTTLLSNIVLPPCGRMSIKALICKSLRMFSTLWLP